VIKKLIIISAIVGLMSCATAPRDFSSEVDGQDYLEGIETDKYSGAIFGGSETSDDPMKKEQFEYYPGTGEFIDYKAAQKQSSTVSKKGEITLNFEGDPLPMIVNLILGDILKENYVIAPGVSGSVTFATVKPINRDQVLPILEMLLSWNNAALVYIEDRYHVMPRAQAIKGNLIPSFGHMEKRNGYTVMVVPLKFIAPAEMEKVLAPYAKEGAIVKADNARNLLFLSGTKRELEMYMDTINIFDVDWLEGMSTGIFTLERVESDTIVAELEAVFGEGADNPLAGMFRFMPLERLNAIMVITPQEKYLHKAEKWIKRLDRSDSEASSNLYVYNVKNIKADDLAGYLNEVFGGGSGRSSQKSSSGKVAPGLNGKEIGSTTKKSNTIKKTSGTNKDGVNITSIEENNQILISSNAQEYDAIMAAISRLDIEPLQVYIEAKVIEVKLTEGHSSGVEWLFGTASNPNSIEPAPDTKTNKNRTYGFDDTVSATLGSSLSYVFSGPDVLASINSKQTEGRVTVLSTPSIFVLNNKEASINVGTQIPIPTNNFGSSFNNGNNNGNFRSSVSYRQTGIKLQVKPRINPGGLVYLELTQEVSSPGAKDPDTNNVPIDNRDLTTEVAIQSGQTIVMGGLISENNNQGYSGVPVLGKVPLLGKLFSNRTVDTDRTELIVLLTPTVIENPEQAKQLTKEYANQFKGLKPLKVKKQSEQK